MNLPSHWNRMPFTAKADWLCRTHQAASYSAACSMLAKRIKPRQPPKKKPAQKYWWNMD